MIHIEKEQSIPDNDSLRVYSETGDYNDSDFIEFYDINEPGIVAGAFHAQYIKYGNLVYQYNDPKELGEAILMIDPESTHTNASFVRMQNELLSKLNGGELEPESLQRAVDSEQEIMEEKISETENLKADNTEEILNNTEEEVKEEVIEEVTSDPVVENIEVGSEVTPEEPNIVNPVIESVTEENLVPAENTPMSLSEEILSYTKNGMSKKLKLRNRV